LDFFASLPDAGLAKGIGQLIYMRLKLLPETRPFSPKTERLTGYPNFGGHLFARKIALRKK
jgi:hypothetical protein